MDTISLTPNRELMAQARDSLRGRWGLAVGTYFVYLLIVLVLPRIPQELNFILGTDIKHSAAWANTGDIIYWIISGPLSLGMAIFWLSIVRDQDARFSQLFSGFNRFGTALGAELLIAIFVLLWSLLLVVPGIIAYLSYSQTFFIIADDKTIGPLAALRKSKEMMYGHRKKLFLLWCRFIGWFLLCILTVGIGFLWLGPYANVSFAKFYENINERNWVVDRT